MISIRTALFVRYCHLPIPYHR